MYECTFDQNDLRFATNDFGRFFQDHCVEVRSALVNLFCGKSLDYPVDTWVGILFENNAVTGNVDVIRAHFRLWYKRIVVRDC